MNNTFIISAKSVKKITCSVLLSLSALIMNAQANYVWANKMGAASADDGYAVTVDALGNVYTTGSFRGTVDFDPGALVFNLTSSGGADIFVSKLDAAGNFIWAKKMGGPSNEYGFSITVDGSGNVITTGYFAGNCDFDPGIGNFSIIPVGISDIFVSKLDAAGNFVWAVSFEAMGEGHAITVDAAGDIYSTGYYVNTADFDPGPSVYNLNSNGAQADVYVCKLDASGNFVWAQSMGGPGTDQGNGIVVDAAGNVLTIGIFGGTADYDPGVGIFNLVSAGAQYNVFVSKLDGTAGGFIWAKSMGGAGGAYGYGVDVDASGNVFTTGKFSGNSDFDPGNAVFNLAPGGGGFSIFVSMLSASGNFVWAKVLGGASGLDCGNSIAIGNGGDVYTTGIFSGIADFDPNPGIANLTSAGASDAFICKLDFSGNYLWAQQLGGSAVDVSKSIALDMYCNIHTTGSFNGTADFDPNPGIVNLTSSGLAEIFISKLQDPVCPIVLPIKLISFKAECKEKPELNWTSINENPKTNYSVERSSDGNDFKAIANLKGTGKSNEPRDYMFRDDNAGEEKYYYRIKEINLEGIENYSQVVTVQICKNKITDAFRVFPNPANEMLNVDISTELNAKGIINDIELNVEITSVMGKIVKKIQSTDLTAGTINIADLEKGIYFISVNTGDKKMVKKFVKE